jgi:hypothetical protein
MTPDDDVMPCPVNTKWVLGVTPGPDDLESWEVERLGQLACTYAFFCGLYEAEKEVWRLRYGAVRNSLWP